MRGIERLPTPQKLTKIYIYIYNFYNVCNVKLLFKTKRTITNCKKKVAEFNVYLKKEYYRNI